MIGVLSLIIWSLTIVVFIKYVIFILSADDHGQGGTFALYSVVSRALQAKLNNPERFRKYNTWLSTVALVSLAMVISDGMLTPVISGTRAVAGERVWGQGQGFGGRGSGQGLGTEAGAGGWVMGRSLGHGQER